MLWPPSDVKVSAVIKRKTAFAYSVRDRCQIRIFIWQYFFPLLSGGQLFILFLLVALAKENYIYAAFSISFTEIITYFSEQKIVVV